MELKSGQHFDESERKAAITSSSATIPGSGAANDAAVTRQRPSEIFQARAASLQANIASVAVFVKELAVYDCQQNHTHEPYQPN